MSRSADACRGAELGVDIYTVIGLAGVAGYIAAYTLLQLGFLDGNGVPYSIANVAAASLVLISLTQDFNLASAITQVVWIVIGVTGLLLRLMQRRSTVYASQNEPAMIGRELAPPDPVAIARLRLTQRSPFRPAPQFERHQGAVRSTG